MDTCFVIQPFDKDKFDRRFDETFAPAIQNANLEPYRVDRDPGVRIPIDVIEKKIIESAICFAEITTDNPNVWYELGYAFACKKDVVMVCSDERKSQTFPFDIQHRHVISYTTGSAGDYKKLEDDITAKIKALQKNAQTVIQLNETPMADREGLKGHEIALLILIMENSFLSDDSISIRTLRYEMERAGYTAVATFVSAKTLEKKQMIRLFSEYDEGDEKFAACQITQNGENWILENQAELEFRLPKQHSPDDIPF